MARARQSREHLSNTLSNSNRAAPIEISSDSEPETGAFYTPAAQSNKNRTPNSQREQQELFYTPTNGIFKDYPLREKESKPDGTQIMAESPTKNALVERASIINDNAGTLSRGIQASEGQETEFSADNQEAVSSIASKQAGAEDREDSIGVFKGTQANKKRIFSDTEEPGVKANEITSTAPAADRLTEESSDDDAPEVVATEDALRMVQGKEQNITEATQKQEALLRKKRQDRNAFLEKQAEDAKKKRKGDDEVPISARKPFIVKNSTFPSLREAQQPGHNEENTVIDLEVEAKATPLLSDSKESIDHRINPPNVPIDPQCPPDILPLDYLEDDDDFGAEVGQGNSRPFKKCRMTHVLYGKKPKDRREGNITYRVSSQPDNPLLAPKANPLARRTKEAWLSGRSGNKSRSDRQPFSKGFLQGN